MKSNNSGEVTRSSLLALALLGFGIVVAGIYFQTGQREVDWSSLDATVLSQPRHVSQFDLQDDRGKSFSNKNLRGHWSMMFFGFTNCPKMCPTTMVELTKMQKLLRQAHSQYVPEIYMVTIDPQRDTQHRLHGFVQAYSKQFHGLRGSKDALEHISREMGIAYMKLTNPNSDVYSISHTGTIMLFNPKGELVAFFTYPHRAHQMAEEYQVIVANS